MQTLRKFLKTITLLCVRVTANIPLSVTRYTRVIQIRHKYIMTL